MNCLNCGQEFEPHTKRQWYCSERCSMAAYRKHPPSTAKTLICKQCGQEFKPKVNDRTTFCSRECAFGCKRDRAGARREIEAALKAQPNRTCVICGKAYTGKSGCHCSGECRKESARRKQKARDVKNHKTRVVKCRECGAAFITKYGDKRKSFCSPRCNNRHNKKANPEQKRDSNHRRRARMNGRRVSRVNRQEIFNRDNWICQICHKPVNRELKNPHPKSASLDHIIPLSLGGSHEPINCQLAHMICNSYKRDQAHAQLRLPIWT